MLPSELFADVQTQFIRRKFAAGLGIAFIDFLVDIGAINAGISDYQGVLKKFPRQTSTAAGGSANTLIVAVADGVTKSIRKFYDRVQLEIRTQHHRLDYPSAAPHATQAWVDYTAWIAAMAQMSEPQIAKLRADILEFILTRLPSHEIDSSTFAKDPPVYFEILTRIFHAFCVLFPAFVGGQAVSLRERASYAG